MKVKEILLLVFIAVCLVLIGGTIQSALAESSEPQRGALGTQQPYQVSIVMPTATKSAPLPTLPPDFTPSFAPAQHDEGHQEPTSTVTPFATEAMDRGPTSDN
ncbi:MAG TPA: hypothetical protein VGA52_16100 [Anaerolineales bacterium]|jgi:hypothetical protein